MSFDAEKNLGDAVVDRETRQGVMPLPYIASYGERCDLNYCAEREKARRDLEAA